MSAAEEPSDEDILVFFYAKHEPEFANLEKVSKITSSFQRKAKKKGGDWREMMYAAMKKQRGEDPRTVYKESQAAGAGGAEGAAAQEAEAAQKAARKRQARDHEDAAARARAATEAAQERLVCDHVEALLDLGWDCHKENFTA